MTALQKLIRNGTSTVVTIPRPVLMALDWLPGMPVVLEVLEDRSIRLRKVNDPALQIKRAPGLSFAPAQESPK